MQFCTFPKREYSIELKLVQLNWNGFAVILKRPISFWYWGLVLDTLWGNPKEISHFVGGVERENSIIATVEPTGSAVSEGTEVSRSSGSEGTFSVSHSISLCCISVHVALLMLWQRHEPNIVVFVRVLAEHTFLEYCRCFKGRGEVQKLLTYPNWKRSIQAEQRTCLES